MINFKAYLISIINAFCNSIFALVLVFVLFDLATKFLMVDFYGGFHDPYALDAIFVKVISDPFIIAFLGLNNLHFLTVPLMLGISLYIAKELILCSENNFFFWGELFLLAGFLGNLVSLLLWNGVLIWLPITEGNRIYLFNLADVYIALGFVVYFVVEPLYDWVNAKFKIFLSAD